MDLTKEEWEFIKQMLKQHQMIAVKEISRLKNQDPWEELVKRYRESLVRCEEILAKLNEALHGQQKHKEFV